MQEGTTMQLTMYDKKDKMTGVIDYDGERGRQ